MKRMRWNVEYDESDLVVSIALEKQVRVSLFKKPKWIIEETRYFIVGEKESEESIIKRISYIKTQMLYNALSNKTPLKAKISEEKKPVSNEELMAVKNAAG